MQRFAFSPPPGSETTAPGQLRVGTATLSVSELAALPDDVAGFVSRELPGAVLAPVAFASGWPAFAAEATAGADRRMILVVYILDRGIIARLDGPAASFDDARAQTLAALAAGTVEWGAPPFFTLAELLAGVQR